MTEYNWNERHIITFPEEKLALTTFFKMLSYNLLVTMYLDISVRKGSDDRSYFKSK